ncbi:MAG: hypothetical protein AAF191_16705 [Verrucomicrobiota bacterium]
MFSRFFVLIALLSVHGRASEGEEREWTSQDGKSFQGRYEHSTEETVSVRRSDGRTFAIPLERLSVEDQEFVQRRQAEEQRAIGLENGPFAEFFGGEWQQLSPDRFGFPVQLFGSPKLRRMKEPFPVFLHLHGAAARANSVETGKVEIAAQRLARDEQYEETPCLIVVPTCPPDTSWGDQVTRLEGLLDELVASLPVDRSRIYLSGYSMGARGVGALLESRPTFYAGAMFADGEAKMAWVDSVDTPLWLWFSGERDLEGAQAVAKAYETAGKKVHFEGFPEYTHNQIHWKLAHSEEVFDWMFSQVRGAAEKLR